MASGVILPILKEALVKLTLGPCPPATWVFVASVTNKFILRLDILHANHASVDLEHHMPCEGVELCRSAIMVPKGTFAFVSVCEQKQQGSK
jgi:hypothetical protein